MESDDDYQSFSLPAESSSPIQPRKLKRLRKAAGVPKSPISPPPLETLVTEKLVDFEKLVVPDPPVADPAVSETLDLEKPVDLETVDSISDPLVVESKGLDDGKDTANEIDDLNRVEHRDVEEKSHLTVTDDVIEEFDGKGESLDATKKRKVDGGEKKKKKRGKSIGDDEKLGDWVRSVSQSKSIHVERDGDSGSGDLDEGFDGIKLGDLIANRKTKKRSAKKRLNLDDEEFDGKEGSTSNGSGDVIDDGKTKKKSAKKRLNLDEGEEKKEKKEKKKKGDVDQDFDGKENSSSNDGKMKKKSSKKRLNLDGQEEKEKKKRGKSTGDKGKLEESARMKKRLEKERQAYLEKLHAESQRLLRETRDASFKPAPALRKPISSILEKIRRRKLEVLQEAGILSKIVETHDAKRENSIDIQAEQVGNNGSEKENAEDRDQHLTDAQNIDINANCIERSRSCETAPLLDQQKKIFSDRDIDMDLGIAPTMHLDATDASSREPASFPSQNQTSLSDTVLDGSKAAFRAPINDTEDLFGSQPSDDEDLELDSHEDSPLEEILAPSMLVMDLKLDSAPPNDISDEEDYNKENLDPYPKGDPVKAFMDDEAEEEDDSDNDLMRFKDNEEEEDHDDDEDLKELIVTGYEEKPIDNEKRDQLHQKWLEQHDAAETDNILQRLKSGLKHKEPILLEEDEEEEEEEFDEDFEDEVSDDLNPSKAARINSKKVKQMIPQMFTEKDAYVSSDDEETEHKLTKQRLLEKAEEHSSFLSPADDESSREVFGLIKKLNVAPDTKKKAKSSSIFDMLITGGNSNSSSKSSFLGRTSSNSLPPPPRKNGPVNFRSFIFGRDDSNSKGGVAATEASSDMGEKENRPAKPATAKFSSSQSKSSSQISTTTKSSGASLLQVLRQSSSMQSSHSVCSNTVGQTQTVVQFAAFKTTKKSIKIDTRA